MFLKPRFDCSGAQTCSGGGIFVRGKSVVTTHRTTWRRNKATRKSGSKVDGLNCGVRRPASAPRSICCCRCGSWPADGWWERGSDEAFCFARRRCCLGSRIVKPKK